MRRDLAASAVAIVLFTIALGVAYPLVVTGVAQVAFPNRADGSLVERDGKVVGSRLIAQDFRGLSYFKPRPSQTDYAGNASSFANLGPNQQELADLTNVRMAAYLERERPHTPGLERSGVPVDAVTNSASGVDPHISQANARIQANRVASERGVSVERVRGLIDQHTDGRVLGMLGEPGVNVLELNLALDEELPST